MLVSTATSFACCWAKSALLFLYREALGIDLPWMDTMVRAKKPQRLPSVLTRAEVARVLERLEGIQFDGASLVWHRDAFDGVRAIVGEGC